MTKKFRVIIDLNFTSNKKFEYEFKFLNISKPGHEIDALSLVEYLKEVTKSLEQKYLGTDSIKESKLYH